MLIKLSRRRDPDEELSFSEVYQTYRKAMLYAAYRVLGDPQDAEDAVQTAFMGIAVRFEAVQKLDRQILKGYLCRSARYCAINLLKKRQKGGTYSDPLPEEEEEPLGSDPADEVAGAADYQRIVRVIRDLPETYRDTLYLHYVEELPDTKIAAVLGEKKETIKKRLVRGKKLLLQNLSEKGITGHESE